MRCQDQVLVISPVGEKGLSGINRLYRITVDPVVPFRVQALDGTVDQIAAQHRVLTPGRQVYGNVTRRMTRGGLEPDMIIKLEVTIHGHDLAGFNYGQHTFLVRRCIGVGNIFHFIPGNDLPGIGEGGYPAPIQQAGVPAAVIAVQMGAEHIIHGRRIDAAGQ